MMTQLTWNNNTGRYQSIEDGHLVEVDGDTFAECRRDRALELLSEKYSELSKEEISEKYEDGSEDWAYDQATEELLDISIWTFSTPMDGVFIDGIDQS